MKLVRHFLVVVVVVAAVVGIGFAWRVSPLAGVVADGRDGRGGGDRPPAGFVAPDGRTVPADGFERDRFDRFRDSGGFSLSRADDLVQTLAIFAVVTTGVVLVDQARRRRKRADFDARRAATATPTTTGA